MLISLFISILLATLLQVLLWVHAVRTTNAGWVDFGWSGGMFLSSGVILFRSDFSASAWIASGILAFWSGRLALHILTDRLLGSRVEDSRYQNLRRHWGDAANRKFFWFFVGQALVVGLFMLPALVVSRSGDTLPRLLDILGVAVAFAAIAGEALADRQLARFRKDPTSKAKVCQRGFWRYSRHPNYFFEWLHWFGYVLMGLGAPYGFLTLLGPILMYVFLRYVTGVPHAERQSLLSRGDAYREYQQTTPVFFPWIPRKP
jgi:steroid 5-alpha reductase family enzyme